MERAHAEAQVRAETSLYKLAVKGNVRALITWLQARRPEDWNWEPLNQHVTCPPRPTAIFHILPNGRELETEMHSGDGSNGHDGSGDAPMSG